MERETAEKAATWWAARVKRPQFSALSQGERRAGNDRAMEWAELMAHLLVEEVSDQQIQTFKQALAESLLPKTGWFSIGVDYGPDEILSDAAQKAGISGHNFPWKTHMTIEADGEINAACGYGSPWETL